MKKALLGILLGMAILCQPIQVQAADAVFPRTHDIKVNSFTYEEAQLLLQIAAAEAEGEGPDGQRMIMSVVLNRVESPDFPNSIKEVVYEPHQFYTAGMSEDKVNVDTHLALADLEAGNKAPEIIAFEKSGSDFLEQYFIPVFTFRHHTFYVLSK